jgi:hypothetical protein
MIVGTEHNQMVYSRVTKMELSHHNGQALLHWRVLDQLEGFYTVVKLMSPDGFVQIKFITDYDTKQIIHNVCELPNNFQL